MNHDLKYIKKIKINNKINDKVFRDFIKYFEVKNSLKIEVQTYELFSNIVKKVATYNDHLFVTQSDLFAMLFIEQNQITNFEEKFYLAMKDTMFKEALYYQSLNSDTKDQFENKFNKQTLSVEEKEHAKKLVEWIKKQIVVFSNEKLIEENPQLLNKVTGNLAIDFFKQQNEIIIRIYKWHANVFEMISK
ncbi:hypothetical protein CK556_03130 [Mesoplasma chauliocola]|uniref:Uncharacterized protein n=1 Tax=Mesoplasma chauliocola TaxID=216427 RepID=A0A249SNY4_9MOLU|nr:hypothetical protein [Mesoplasma chauliocola]ASZ09322.1 hypothetical protein CK556_03130 [Mesoplasma chauliocola]